MTARRGGPAALVALFGALLVAGCTAGASSPTPASAPPTLAPTAGPATPIPSTVTPWGPILDGGPPTFPRYAGARDTTAPQAASQVLVTEAKVADVSGWYHQALVAAGFSGAGPGAPAEDGSMVEAFDGSGVASGCRAQVSAKPQGTETLIVILYGADCPAK